MKGCEREIEAISDKDIEWFYKISPEGLAIKEKDLHLILKDRNMPKETKAAVLELFPELGQRKWKFWLV